MRLLARSHLAGQIHIEGICLNGCTEHSVASVEGFLNTEGVYGVPLGIDLKGDDFGGQSPYQKRLARYAKIYSSNQEAEEGVSLYRKILSESKENLEIIEIGYLQVFASLLESMGDSISPKTGLELISEKVSKVWVMAGKWDQEKGIEHNFARNERARNAASIFCDKVPVPVTFLGFEVGVDVYTGGNLSGDDALHMALRDHGSQNGRNSWDPMLALLAIIGDEEKAGYKLIKGKGFVDPKTGENTFTESQDGIHGYVVKTKENSWYRDTINNLIQ